MTDPDNRADAERAREIEERTSQRLNLMIVTGDGKGEFPPYNADEQRVCDYLQTIGNFGCGADPIGFLIASHSYVLGCEKSARSEDHAQGLREGVEKAEALAIEWTKPSALLLACGEMPAQELRTALAVAKGLARRIRALLPSAPNADKEE